MLAIVRCIDIGMPLQKQTYDLVVSCSRSYEQGRFTHSVAGIDRRSGPEQRLHKEAVARLCRPMQRRCSVG